MPRPKPDFEAVPILLRLHPDTVAHIDKHRGDLPRNRWVSWLVTAWLADQMPKLTPEQDRDGMKRISARVKAEEDAKAAKAKTPTKAKKAASESPVATDSVQLGFTRAAYGERLKRR